ncbi:MAG: hypothetical protein M1817_006093 [Caeruleum heppii]|nr:MAG: hypothetical protein M1817_006093 [Caeruleum heppii]
MESSPHVTSGGDQPDVIMLDCPHNTENDEIIDENINLSPDIDDNDQAPPLTSHPDRGPQTHSSGAPYSKRVIEYRVLKRIASLLGPTLRIHPRGTEPWYPARYINRIYSALLNYLSDRELDNADLESVLSDLQGGTIYPEDAVIHPPRLTRTCWYDSRARKEVKRRMRIHSGDLDQRLTTVEALERAETRIVDLGARGKALFDRIWDLSGQNVRMVPREEQSISTEVAEPEEKTEDLDSPEREVIDLTIPEIIEISSSSSSLSSSSSSSSSNLTEILSKEIDILIHSSSSTHRLSSSSTLHSHPQTHHQYHQETNPAPRDHSPPPPPQPPSNRNKIIEVVITRPPPMPQPVPLAEVFRRERIWETQGWDLIWEEGSGVG